MKKKNLLCQTNLDRKCIDEEHYPVERKEDFVLMWIYFHKQL